MRPQSRDRCRRGIIHAPSRKPDIKYFSRNPHGHEQTPDCAQSLVCSGMYTGSQERLECVLWVLTSRPKSLRAPKDVSYAKFSESMHKQREYFGRTKTTRRCALGYGVGRPLRRLPVHEHAPPRARCRMLRESNVCVQCTR